MTDEEREVMDHLMARAREMRLCVKRLVRVAGTLTPEERDRLTPVMETLQIFSDQLRDIAESLPDDNNGIPPEKATLSSSEFRARIERAVQDHLIVVVNELNELADRPN